MSSTEQQIHRTRRLARSVIFAIVVAALGPGSYSEPSAQSLPGPEELRLFRIGTGGPQGTYFPIGSLIAASVSEGTVACGTNARCGIQGLLAVAQLSNGSVSNVEAIGAGVLEAGLVQADVAHWAYTGTGSFSGKPRHTELRAIASLYQESIHIVVRQGSGISRIRDLKGKRVSLDEPGSGTLVDARIVLSASGLSEDDVHPVYIKPQFAVEKLKRNDLDAFFIVAGYPTQSVVDVTRHGTAGLIPVEFPVAEKIEGMYPFLTPSMIPGETYAGVPEVQTVSVFAQLLVDASLPSDVAYQITRALWSERTSGLLKKGHPKGKDIRLESALDGIAIPLHPGAKRFYSERNSARVSE